jgi:SAM-dependent methyltransferase
VLTVEFSRLRLLPGDRILDIGCGTGRHVCGAYRLREVVAIGADLNQRDVLEAKKGLEFHDATGEHGGGVWGVTVADITCLPFDDHTFDLVICSEVLEHIPDETTAIDEIIRVLKPGKNLVVSVPRYLPERICWALSDAYHHSSGGHIRIYRQRHLIDLLENAGTKRWASHFSHSIHTPFWWLKCLVGPGKEDNTLVNLYHRLLVWDILKQPRITRFLDRLLNPILGKSITLYLKKEPIASSAALCPMS